MSTLPIPDSDLVTIYQHRAMSGVDRYYCDTQIPNNYGWGDGIPVFRAFSSRQPDTVAIYRHKAKQGIDRYYFDKQVPNIYGWEDGAVLCYAYDSPRAGTIPVYIHSAPNPDRYFLDTEIPNNYGWTAGTVLCYAYPVNGRSLIDEITDILGWQGAHYKGSTYMDSSNNRYTILDTPGVWDQGPSFSTSDALKNLLNEIFNTIAIAEKYVDITLLWQIGRGLPVGNFQTAIGGGIQQLIRSKKRPLFRIMIGVPIGVAVTPNDLQKWLQHTIELDGQTKITDVNFTIQIACCKQSVTSWNHSKIVASDGIIAVVGGHNLWQDYFGYQPVHDVSMKVEGFAVASTHRFCDLLWKKLSVLPHFVVLKDGKFTALPTPVERTEQSTDPTWQFGKTRMLSLGRLGEGLCDSLTVASNASVSARIVAICKAKKNIRISQQSLCFTPGGFDFYTVWALVKAIEAGVTVDIIVSNDTDMSGGGYKGNLSLVVESLAQLFVASRLGIYHPPSNPSRDNLDGWASASINPPFNSILINWCSGREKECIPIIKELNEKLTVAPLYYAKDVNYWLVNNQKMMAANHAKVYIIDDKAFYVGSDNLYLSGSPHGLQEYGFLIEGQEETNEFINNYWNKAWKNSQPRRQEAKGILPR